MTFIPVVMLIIGALLIYSGIKGTTPVAIIKGVVA